MSAAAARREEQEAVAPHFVASSEFAGGKQGMIFKKGALGVGYYRDSLQRSTEQHHKLKPQIKSR